MARHRKQSKKRSAASSTDEPPERTVFYLDESIYSRALASAIVTAGARVRTPQEVAGFGAPDEDWLAMVGDSVCIVLMRDQRVRYRTLEKQALMDAGVGAFVFTGGQATAADTADVITRLLSKFIHINRSERRPFLYSFGLSGSLTRISLRR